MTMAYTTMATAPSREEFGEKLKILRIKRGLSYADVADRIGRKKSYVRRLERGEATPQGSEVPRLQATFPQLKPYLEALCRGEPGDAPGEQVEEAPTVELSDADREADRAAAELDTTPPPAPRTFGGWLQRCRLEEGLSQDELGELVGVSGSAVWYWEDDESVPVQENYRRLLELLPALADAPDPGARDIPKPDGGAGLARVIALPGGRLEVTREEGAGPVLAEETAAVTGDDDVRCEPDCHACAGQRFAEAAIVREEEHARLLADAGARYADALVKARRERAFLAELEAEVESARADVAAAERGVEDARCALDEAVAAAAGHGNGEG